MIHDEQRRHLATAQILFVAGIISLSIALYISMSSVLLSTNPSPIASPLLSFVIDYGYPMLVVAIVLAYLGVPISLNAMLLAVGALAVSGRLNVVVLIILAAVFATLGDVFNYYIGKKLRHFRYHKHVLRFSLSDPHMHEVDRFIKKWGKWSIFLTRWLLTPLGIPVNVVAGARKYPFKPFVTISLVGETLWACLYIFLGFLLGASWVALWQHTGSIPQIAAFTLLGVGALFIAMRILHNHHKIPAKT